MKTASRCGRGAVRRHLDGSAFVCVNKRKKKKKKNNKKKKKKKKETMMKLSL